MALGIGALAATAATPMTTRAELQVLTPSQLDLVTAAGVEVDVASFAGAVGNLAGARTDTRIHAVSTGWLEAAWVRRLPAAAAPRMSKSAQWRPLSATALREARSAFTPTTESSRTASHRAGRSPCRARRHRTSPGSGRPSSRSCGSACPHRRHHEVEAELMRGKCHRGTSLGIDVLRFCRRRQMPAAPSRAGANRRCACTVLRRDFDKGELS